MKTPSAELFELIRSLSTQEKVQFKLYASRKKAESDYIKLFDAIDQQGEYNEALIKKKLKNVPLVKHLDRVKSYVIESILKCLQEYHSSDSATSTLCNFIQQIELLMSKRLFVSAKKIITRAEKAARGAHNYYYLGIILSLRREVMVAETNLEELNNYSVKIYPEEIRSVKKLKNTVDYTKLHVQVIGATYSQSWTAHKNLKILLKDPLLRSETNALSLPARINYHDISGRIFYLLDDWSKSFRHYKKIVFILEQHPLYLESRAEFYLTVLSRMLVINIRQKKDEELILLYRKVKSYMDSLPKKLWSKSIFRIYMGINNNYIARHLQSHHLKEALRLSEEINKSLIKQFDTQVLMVFNMNRFMIYFYLNDFHKALPCVSTILAEERTGIRKDLVYDMKFLNLMLHYELGNSEMLPNLCRSTERYLGKTRPLNSLERSAFHFFSRVILKADTKKERINAFAGLQKELHRHKKERIGKFFDFDAWVESKIESKPFSEVVKNREQNE